MLKRLLTGIVYLAVLLAFYLARVLLQDQFWGMLLFDLLILLFALCGTFEMVRAFQDRLSGLQKALVMIFSAALLLCYSLSDIAFKFFSAKDVAFPAVFAATVGAAAILLAVLVVRHEKTSLESVGFSLLALLYPSVFLLTLSAVNHMSLGALGLLFVFAICPFADCFAFVFGVLFKKKLPRKMAPHVSPHKTVIGGIGGILGGALGAVCIFFAYYGLVARTDFPYQNLAWFVLLGVIVSVFAEFGDLVESALKRKIGIKDMGKILPGHGGVLDRIDSALYASPAVALVLWLGLMTGI